MKNKQLKFKKRISQIPENAVFWLILFSLAVGSAASLHQKVSDRAASYEVHTEHINTAQVSADLRVKGMVDLPSLHAAAARCHLTDRNQLVSAGN